MKIKLGVFGSSKEQETAIKTFLFEEDLLVSFHPIEANYQESEQPFSIVLYFLTSVESSEEVAKNFLQFYPAAWKIAIASFQNFEQVLIKIESDLNDFIVYPFGQEELILRLHKAKDNHQLQTQAKYLTRQLKEDWDEKFVLGNSPNMRKVYEDVEVIAQSNALTVFIHGETGTGKELVAHQIHNLSHRAAFPFVEINTTALPPELLESELFGHEAGAFTGAKSMKKGLFEAADGGTLFLDEIGDMDLTMQAKILRALQERKIRRVGGTQHIDVNIRLITATNKDLAHEVQKGLFRRDLFYRLNVVSIYLPPLRDRGKDIEVLASHFIDQYNRAFSRNVSHISPEASELLLKYSWPGNVRELKNMMEHTLLLECDGDTLEARHLKFSKTAHYGANKENLSQVLSEEQKLQEINFIIGKEIPLWQVEKEHIRLVLELVQGNKNRAAKILQIDRTTLYNKIKKYHLN